MKLLLVFFLLLIQHIICAQQKDFTVKYYLSNDSIQEFSTNHIDTIRKKAIYNKAIFIDSIESYKNGRLNGPKIIFSDIIFLNEYKDDSLISEKVFNSDYRLLYSYPLDITKVKKSAFSFSSNRKYFDRSKKDTITIVNRTIPPDNIGISLTGAMATKFGKSSYIIQAKKDIKDLKEIIIRIQTHYGTDKNGRELIKNEVFKIPVK